MRTVFTYILYFFFYSAVGWCFESCYCSIGERKLINRGFLTGPMCPIYGTGTLVMEILLYLPFKDKPLLVFFLGMVFCDIVEYVTSFLMEKLFNARWWNYKDELFNIHGRICFKHTLFWGAAAVAFVRFVHPMVEDLFKTLPDKGVYIAVSIIFCIFSVDVIWAVIKASDIRKLKAKLIEFKETLSDTAAVHAVESVKNSILDVYDALNHILDKGNDKINRARDDLIIDALTSIQKFDDKIRFYGKNKERKNLRLAMRKVIKERGKTKISVKALLGDIKSVIEQLKQEK